MLLAFAMLKLWVRVPSAPLYSIRTYGEKDASDKTYWNATWNGTMSVFRRNTLKTRVKRMSINHSPGPWSSGYNTYTNEQAGRIERRFWLADAELRIVPMDTCMGESAEANARLIAAAPDLLEACEKVAAYCHNIEHSEDEYCNERIVAKMVAAAIAKATGQNAVWIPHERGQFDR